MRTHCPHRAGSPHHTQADLRSRGPTLQSPEKVTFGGYKASSLSWSCPAGYCCSLPRYESSAWYSIPSTCLGLYSVPFTELHLWNFTPFYSVHISHMVFRTVKKNENYYHYGYLRWKSTQPAGMHNSCKIQGLHCPGLA